MAANTVCACSGIRKFAVNPNGSANPESNIAAGRVLRCLIIDDNPDDRFFITRMLRRDPVFQYQIVEAASGSEGMAALSAGHFDVLLLDYMLPREDGLSILAQVRARDPNIAIVFVTGYDDRNLAQQATDLGADHFLYKSELESSAVFHGVQVALQRRRTVAVEEELSLVDEVARTFSSYVPEDLARAMLRREANGVGGEVARTLPAVILFGDIVHSTEIGQALDAAATITFLSSVFARFDEILVHRGGILEKIIGDGILAIFPAEGLPGEALQAVIVSAVASGFELIRAYRDLWNRTAVSRQVESGFRVGLAFGDVIRGNVGSARRRDFTVIGQTVNLAKRLETQAPVNHLMFDDSIYRRLPNPEIAVPVGRVSLKGIPDPVPAYQAAPSDVSRQAPPRPPARKAADGT